MDIESNINEKFVELLKESADFVAVIEEYHKNRKA